MADAVFTEVLEIEIAVDSFKQGLATLETAYEEFVDRLNAKGFGAGSVIAVGAFTALEQQINQLTANMTAFDGEVTTAFTQVDAQLKGLQSSIQTTGQAAVDAKAKIAAEQASNPTAGGSGGGSSVSPNAFSQLVGGPGTFMQGISNAVSSINGGLLGMLGYMAALRLAWTAVGTAINIVVAIIKSPFEVIKAGFEYLTKIQDEAASMQGTIAANAKLSADLGKNFQLAGQAAHQIAVEMQQLSIDMKVPTSQLEHLFNDVLESGGLHFTHTLQGVVDLTKEFALAVSKSSTETEGQRKAMNEIPKLLEGQDVTGSRILNTLGLTNAEWQKLRAEALAHGNLVEKLADLMKPYLTVVEDANLRQSALIESLKLQGSQIAGAIALPLWGQFTGVLQNVNTFVKDNTTSMVAFGSSIIGVGQDFGSLLAKIFEVVKNSTTLRLIFDGIGQVIVVSVFAVRSLLDIITLGVSQLAQLMTFVNSPDKWFSRAAWKDAFAQIQKDGQDAFNKIQDAAVDAGTALWAKEGAKPSSNPELNTQVDPKKALIDPNAEKEAAKEREAAFHANQEAFRTELAQTKEKFAETEADIKARQETGLISFHEASLEKIDALHAERDAIKELVQYYTDLALTSGAKPKSVKDAVSSLGRVDDASQSATKIAITSTVAADEANDEHTTQAHLSRLDQMELAHQRNMLSLYKQQASLGLISKTELFDREVALSKAEHDAVVNNLQQEIENAGANTAKKLQLQDELAAEDQRYTDAVTAHTGARSAIAEKEALDLQRQTERISELQARKLALDDKVGAHGAVANTQMVKSELDLAKVQTQNAQNEVQRAQRNLDEALTIDAKTAATERLLKAQIDLDNANLHQQAMQAETASGSSAAAIFGKGVTADDVTQMVQHPFDDFKSTVGDLGNSFQFFGKAASGLIAGIKSGFASGGIAGALGGAASSIGSTISSLGPAFGPAGAIVSGVGQIFSLFGSLFTSHAKKVADDIQKSVNALMQQYSNGQSTLVATITGLEQQRANAIAELSGQKGGQDQLNKLLPQIDQQIAQLKLQQKQVLETFVQNLAVLQTHSNVLGQVLSTWTQINKQVKDYLDAGGSAANAAQFLSLSLQQQLQTTSDSLLTAQDSAIQDAMKLNDLLTQRVDLAKQFAQQEFALKNQDALERMANPAVNAGLTYQAQKAANDAQVAALDQQITLFTTRVSMEKQVFDLAQSTAALQQQSNQINIAQLQETIKTWQDMKKVIAGIFQNKDGSFGTSLFTPAGTTNNKTVNVAPGAIVINTTGTTDGSTLAIQLARELSLIGQFGANTSYA